MSEIWEPKLVLSVRPHWANLIMEGKKTVELRRRFSRALPIDTVAALYVSAPVSAIIGTVQIEKITFHSPTELLSIIGDCACVDEHSYFEYFRGVEIGVAIFLKNPTEIMRPIPLKCLKEKYGFTPPVSWRWLRQSDSKILRAP